MQNLAGAYQKQRRELEAVVERAYDLIANARVEQAIDELLQFDEQIDPDRELIELKGQWVKNERDNLRNVITRSDYLVRYNQLVSYLMSYLKTLLQTYAEVAFERSNARIQLPEAVIEEKLTREQSHILRMDWLRRAYEASKSVARLQVAELNGNTLFGTGFIGPEGWLYTNHHVIDSVASARRTRVEFNFLESGPTYHYELLPETWMGDAQLDFIRVRLQDRPDFPLANLGALPIHPRTNLQAGERLQIIQHPDGGALSISLERNGILRIHPPHLYYTNDTLGGSSGAPILDENWQVVGLHRGAASQEAANVGVLFSAIQDHLDQIHLQPAVAPTPTPIEAETKSIGRPVPSAGPPTIFWLYPTEAKAEVERMQMHFKMMEQSGRLSQLDMHRDVPLDVQQADWIEAQISVARMVLCVLTPTFMLENAAYVSHAQGLGKPLVPIRLKPMDLKYTPFEGLVSLPRDPAVIEEWSSKDAAYLEIVQRVGAHLESMGSPGV